MRQKIVLAAFFLVAFSTAFSQEKRELNWQDFKNSVQRTDLVQPVRWGTLTVFQIKDINKFLYKVTIAGRMFELQTPMPSELQALFRLTPSELQKTETSTKTQEALGQVETGVAKTNQLLTENADEPIEQTFNNLKAGYLLYLDKVKQLSNDILALKSSRNRLISIAQKDMSHAQISAEVAAVAQPTSAIRTHYTDVKDQYARTVALIDLALLEAGSDADLKNKITAIANGLKRAETLIEEESLLGLIDDVDYLHTELTSVSNFTVTAPPVQMDGDLVSYEVSITPTITRALAPYRNPMKFTFDVPAKGGVKVDFSVGPALSFGNNARDEKYFLAETESADTVQLKGRVNKNAVSPGIGAFMHVYPHGGKVGGLFGVGAGFHNTDDLNMNLYLGLTSVWGKSQKVMGSLGVSYLKVQRIKEEQFVAGNKYPVSKIDLAEVTESVYQPSFFISISYNLSNRTEIRR